MIGVLRQRSWSWLLRTLLIPAGDLAFGQRLMMRLRFLEQAQWWEPKRLEGYRATALSRLIATAYHEVPFYRDLMKTAGITPDDVQSPADLRKIPIATKQMLRAGYPNRTTRKTRQRTYEVSSSGSTGANFYVREDPETAGFNRASFLLALQWTGWHIGEPHLQTGITLQRTADRRLKDAILRCHYVSAYDLSDSALDAALDLMDRYRIEHLWGYPGSLYFLAQRATKKGWNRPLRGVVTWGDNLYAHYRRTIEGTFKSRIHDTYGCGEGIQIAAQCGSTDTYHVHAPDVIVECVDDNGDPIARGELGNIIITRLHPGPMPLIRYRIGDVGILGDSQSCKCGRGYEILQSIQGRDTDIVITPSGNRLIVEFFVGILAHFREVDCFQVVQERAESIVLRLVPASGFRENTVAKIVSELREKGGRDLNVEVDVVTEIPLSPSGKRRFVIANPTLRLGAGVSGAGGSLPRASN
jgi:phenylacetate-CoA ligase